MVDIIQYSNQKHRLRYAAIAGGLLLLVVVGINLLTTYLTKGELVVKGDQKAKISISVLDSKTLGASEEATGSLDIHLRPGSYTVTVTDGNRSTQQLATIKSRQKQVLQIVPKDTLPAEYVSNRAASNITVSRSDLAFIDSNNGNTYRVSAANDLRLVDYAHNFQQIVWADPNYGLGSDEQNNLFEINGNTVTPFTTPFPDSKATSQYVTPDHTIYVTNKTSLYRLTPGGTYQQIYKANNTTDKIAVISVAGGAILIKQTVLAAKNGNNSNDAYESKYLLLNHNGGVDATTSHAAYEAVLSPDGKRVAFSGDATQVLGDSFKSSVSIPASNVNSLVWRDDHTLLYGISGGLWQYDITVGRAEKLADFSDTGSVSHLTITPSKNSVYVLVQKTEATEGGQYYLSRVALTPKTFDVTLLKKLSIYFPNSDGSCSFEFVNFTRPSIVVQGPSDSQQTCLDKAKTYLKLYAVDTANLPLIFVASD